MMLIGLGSSLGTGLFLGSGAAISVAGPGVILSFAVGAVIAGIVAWAMADMTSVHPVSGGFGASARRYLGPWAGFITRWMYWVAVVVAVGGEVAASAIYLQFWWPQIPLWLPIAVFAAAILTVNSVGVRSFGNVESAFSTIKILGVVVFLVIGVVLIVFGLPEQDATGIENWVAHGGFLPNGVFSAWLVMGLVIFSYVGIELITISAAEAKDPSRSVRTAMRSMAVRFTLFYVGSMAVIVAIVPWRQLGADEDVLSSPFVLLFSQAGIPAAATITNILVLIAALSAANANTYAAARILFSLSEDRLAPAMLQRTSRRAVPVLSVLASGLGLLATTVLAASEVANIFTLLTAVATFSVIVVWIMILLSRVAFARSSEARSPTGLPLPGGSATALVGVLALIGVLLTGFAVDDMRMAAFVGIPVFIALSVLYVLVVRPRARLREREQAPAE